MDNLFKIRALTTAVNEIRTGETRIYDRYFRGKENMQMTDRLAFDVISGSETVMKNISIYAESPVGEKTSRRTVTLQAPRLAEKRTILAAEINAMRAYGEQFAVESMKQRIAREQLDMKAKFDRTLEFWACNAMKGIIYDSDLTTELHNYGLPGTHSITLGAGLGWDDTAGVPIKDLRTWKRLIEDDAMTNITGWHLYCGSTAMDSLLNNESLLTLLQSQYGVQLVNTGVIGKVAGVDIEEYNGSYLDSVGTRRRFITAEQVMLIGECSDLTDCPFAPVIVNEGVGNVGKGNKNVMFFSEMWDRKDPDGYFLRVEGRPLPVLKRPGAIIVADVVT